MRSRNSSSPTRRLPSPTRLLPLIPLLPMLLVPACSGEGSGAGGGGSGGSGGNPSDAWPVHPDTGLRVDDMGPVPDLPEWGDNPASANAFWGADCPTL